MSQRNQVGNRRPGSSEEYEYKHGAKATQGPKDCLSIHVVLAAPFPKGTLQPGLTKFRSF